MGDAGQIARWTIALLVATALHLPGAEAATKPRAIAIMPFDTSTLDSEQRWIGEGVSEIISLGLAQHPAFVAVDGARGRAGQAAGGKWGAVGEGARTRLAAR